MLILKNKNAEWPKLYPKVVRELGTVKKKGWVEVDGVRLRDGIDFIPQIGLQEEMITEDVDIQLLGGQIGGGKAQPYSADIYTPCGVKKMGDLIVGDIICSTSGENQEILAIYEQGIQDIYKLKFIDGSEAMCTLDHLWKTRQAMAQSKPHRKSASKDRIELSWRIKPFSEIKKYLDEKKEGQHKKHNLLIPLSSAVEFELKETQIDPYIIGLILGDGCISERDTCIGFSTKDESLLTNFTKQGWNATPADKKNISYRITNCHNLRSELDNLKLWNTKSDTKFIPDIYKFTSIENRFAMIQGLMDTDGTCDSRGHLSYCSTSSQMAKDFQWIIWSLGGKATIREKKAFYRDKGKNKIFGKIAYDIYVQTPFNKDLFRLKRKKDRCVEGFNGGFSPLTRRIIDYEYIGKENCRCIYVSNEDHLYLTNDFTVTHNTMGLLLAALDGIHVRGYGALIVKKQLISTKSGAGGIIDDAKRVYDFAGSEFTGSDNPTFTFPAWGTSVTFTHANFSAATEKGLSDAQERFKGFQNVRIMIDEATDHDWRICNYLLSRNRDSSGMKPKFIMTFNTNSHHFTRTLIDWWLKTLPDGRAIPDPEKAGKVRYIHIRGNSVRDIVWGDSREEVVKKSNIVVPDDLKAIGMTPEDMVKSITFRPCKMAENRVLMSATQGGHATNAFNLGDTETNKLFYENWNEESDGESTVSKEMIYDIWSNPHAAGETMYASLDVAGGGDNCVMYIWKELTIIAIENFYGDPQELELWIKATLNQYHVPIQNMSFDATGIGNYLKGYTAGRPVTSNMRPMQEYDEAGNAVTMELYFNIRSQLMGKTQYLLETGQISCKVDMYKNYPHGKHKSPKPLLDILCEEIDVFRRTTRTNGKFYFKNKDEFKDRFGYSPDYMDALIYRSIFILDGKDRKEMVQEFTAADYAGLYNGWG